MGNVKLIIEIPEWYYEETKEFKHPTLIDKAIINGTPLDSVIKDIKAEIDRTAFSTDAVLKIIDKHIADMRGEENE